MSPRSLRTFITCVCFGAVFLWILHGSYMDAQDELPEHRRPLAHYRRLLAVSTAVNDTTPVLASTGSNTSDRKVNTHLICSCHHCSINSLSPHTFSLSLSLSLFLSPLPLSLLSFSSFPPRSALTYTVSQAMRANVTLSRQWTVVKATVV